MSNIRAFLGIAMISMYSWFAFGQQQKNEELIAILDTVYRNEQNPIRTRDQLGDKFGAESDTAQVYQKIYKKITS